MFLPSLFVVSWSSKRMKASLLLGIVLLASQEVHVLSQPPGGIEGLPDVIGQEACLDLVFMFDISCSVSEANQLKAVEFSKRLIEEIRMREKPEGFSVKLAAALFEGDVNNAFYLNAANSRAEMLELLDTLPELIESTSIQCDTMTQEGVKALYETYFTEANGDRKQLYRDQELYQNVAIFFTDARTHPRKYALDGRALDKYLKRAAEARITNYVVLLDNNRTEEDANGNEVTKPPLDHLKITDNEPKRLFDIRTGKDVEAEVTKLAKTLNEEYVCQTSVDRACADITFAFDVSCSIDKDIKELYRYVASQTYNELINSAGDILVSAIVFDVTSRSQFYFDTYGNREVNISKIDNALRNLALEEVKCRTITEKLFDEVNRKHLGKHGDRDDIQNILVLFYDGMTSPLRRRKETIAKALELKKNGVDIHLVRLENNRGKDGDEEFQEIASPDRLFPLESGNALTDENKDAVVLELFDKLRLYACEDQV
ncbi:unnamed protein product [Owenia fusiformis]|uniref:VWFA domain-containing protein n=1 Tax=Owenia fusiformis TaxID=6347 RepID=A0A8S4PC95_OWEFU|nr:unnamed protein product [Owenia fusiformis]